MSLNRKVVSDGENVYRINRNQVASGKMSLKQKGGERWGDRIPY